VVEEFVYLGSLVHSTIQSHPAISHRSAITRAAIRDVGRNLRVWAHMASAVVRAYNVGLGQSPQQGPGAAPLVGGLKLNTFSLLDVQ